MSATPGEPRGHAPHEQQAVYGALVASEHDMTSARGHRATAVNPAVAMGAERVQQRQGFVSGSVPGNSLHEPISIDRVDDPSVAAPR